MILRDGGPQLEKATGKRPAFAMIGPDNIWLVARHEDGTISTDDERRRRAVTRTAGCDVHDVTDAGHETRLLPHLYIPIGTVTEGQKG